MRILHTVELYAPSVGGAQEVVRQISERLAAAGHEVTVATRRLPERESKVVNGVQIEEFSITGNAATGMEGEVERYREFLRTGAFDVMLNYAAQQWATDLALPLLGDLPYATALAPCGFSGLLLPDYAGYFAGLPAALALYDRIVLHSETYRDAEYLRRHSLGNICLIPNGAAAEEFEAEAALDFRRKHGISPDTPLILTVGSHTGMKGHDLVLESFRRLRARRAVLAIVGGPGNPGCVAECRRSARAITLRSLGRKRVLLLDPPRPEVVAAYDAADVFVCGSRVECSPVVLFEAAASGTPFVSVAVGNSAEIAAWTGAGTIVATDTGPDGYASADPDLVAAEIDALIEDPARRAALGEAGRRSWRNGFRWDLLSRRYEDLYAELVVERTAGAAR